jgi:hypothetical protein
MSKYFSCNLAVGDEGELTASANAPVESELTRIRRLAAAMDIIMDGFYFNGTFFT